MAQAPLTAAGRIGIGFGALVFGLGVLAGPSIFWCGLGLLFIAGGYVSREKRACPACKLEVPVGATVCGHCRRELAA